MAKLFGTDGVRGIANQYPMTAEFALKLAMACGQEICKSRKKVIIAKDTRVSGDMLESALCAGFTSAGVDVVLLGVLPTPALTVITSSYQADMAVMITASHNPYHDNGIKLINAEGDKFGDDVTASLEKLVQEGTFVLNPDEIGRVSHDDKALSKYLDVISQIPPSSNALKGLKLVVDCANGAFSHILPDVFMKLGAGVLVIGNEPDGFNINKACGSQHIEKMQETVRGAHADMGIAVDGDGDRIIICDENGAKIPSEQLIAFVADYLFAQGLLEKKAVVSTILSNTGLEKYVRQKGWDYYSTPVGERYVIEKMQEIGASAGGEESGHVVVSKFSKTGDGLVVGLLVALGVLAQKKKVSEIFPLFGFEPLFYKNPRFASKEVLAQIVADEGVQKAAERAKEIMKTCGRVVLRPSGTEPLMRVWVCGSDEQKVQEAGNLIMSEIARFQ